MDYFDRLERELSAAAARAPSTPDRAYQRPRQARRWGLAALAVLLVGAPAATAITGVWPEREPDGLVRTADKTVIAEGDSPEFGRWQAFESDSAAGPCLGLRLLDETGGTSEGCGITDAPARLAGGSGRDRTAIFGFVPPEATAVRIDAEGIAPRTYPTFDRPDRKRAFFFVSIPKTNPPGLRLVPMANGQSLEAIDLGDRSEHDAR